MGWMGLMSVPMISADGYASDMSMAQMPVPVPTSRTLVGGLDRGASNSLSPRTMVMKWCEMSSPSFCRSSLGPQYWVVLEFWYVRPWMLR